MSTDENFTAEPTMTDVCPAFQFDAALQHKRKRRIDDPSDESLMTRSPKRRPPHQCLPIRLSPSARPQLQSQAYSTFTSIYQQPPTPVDTSEDESPSEPKDASHWPTTNKSRPTRDSQGSDSSSMSSIRAQCGDHHNVDVNMDLNPPTIRRARSNDIIPPYRDSNFLTAMDTFARERVPTPISSHFDNRVADLPSVPRHQFPPLRTNLSPMIEQDSWIGRDGLPSPVEDDRRDTDSMMVDQQGDGDGLLRCGEPPAHVPMDERCDDGGLQLDGYSSPGGKARTARLHMGFLNGCDKCIQKVPGHYSHILWS
ncbi:uncharacterized protein PV06_01153 [Exophiala oligosperma]|uniref:Uncharacterized protein n=1 Tax=Exophiala oligosperma TaxID=215243 RepID=A0A0D2B8R2_9EURO|nr:uncharacterized protein PV06_01153 [Exophiala oligosperma]KIW48581.1 hypothetical protein PV06_01153 [Exophiala oligosperma]